MASFVVKLKEVVVTVQALDVTRRDTHLGVMLRHFVLNELEDPLVSGVSCPQRSEGGSRVEIHMVGRRLTQIHVVQVGSIEMYLTLLAPTF